LDINITYASINLPDINLTG